MRTTTFALAATLAVAAGIGTQRPWAAQALQPGQAGPRPALFVSASSVSTSGGRAGMAGGEHPFVAGQTTTRTLFAGNLSAGTTCGAGTSAPASSLNEQLAQRPYVWQIGMSPARHEEGRLFFDLEWARYEAASGASPVASGRQVLAMDEGDRLVLDLVHATADDEDCGSVLVEVEARMHEDPALADLLIRYDVWLMHTDPAGRTESQWVVTTARHGVDVPFGLPAQRIPVPRLAPDQFDFDIMTRVEGRLRARVEADGTLAVDLLAARGDSLERRDLLGGGFRGGPGQGRRRLYMRPGEAVQIDLPPPTGARFAVATPDAPGLSGRQEVQPGVAPALPPAPVTLENGQITVRMPAFFDGHTLALLLQARLIGG